MTIKHLYVDRSVADGKSVARFEARLGLTAVEVADPREIYEWVGASEDPVQLGKEVLLLTRNRGPFLRQCPGTRYYTCCGYKILHIGTYCVMDCAYCILQSYFHPPILQFFLNHQDLAVQLNALFDEKGIHRIGTGEFTDSMIWEYWTDLAADLIPFFATQSRAVLELKTKTTAIRKLQGLDHRRRTIMAWSVNTDAVIQEEERGTASLDARLKAAAQCEAWGYPLAFHFDPMIIYDGCEEDYRSVVTRIFERISAHNVVWISLGTFRFMPALKAVIEKRFPTSKIVYGEFIPGMDGKMRYFKPLRIDLYRKVAEWIRMCAPEVPVYFCMEDDEVWHKSLGFFPSQPGGLPAMLDASAVKVCGLDSP